MKTSRYWIKSRHFLLFAFFTTCVQINLLATEAATFRTILTAKDTDARLSEQPVMRLGTNADSSLPSIFVDPAHQFQTIVGFKGAFLFAGLAMSLTVQAALTPVDLRCALRVNPLGLGDVNPRLSWQLQSDGQVRGEVQSAYQMQVGSTPGAADLWDSGKVVKCDFTSPGSKNGDCDYASITLFGTASVIPPANLNASLLLSLTGPASLVIYFNSLVSSQN